MASTNKTANVKLNQWILTDPPLMEDFNADNQKIDTAITEAKQAASAAHTVANTANTAAQSAIAKNLWEKLFDVTVNASGITTVEMDLSGIDMTQYSELRLCKIPATANATMFVRLNKQTNYHYRDYLKNWGAGVGAACNFTEGYADFCLASGNVYVHDIIMFYRAASTIKIPNFTSINILANVDGTGSLDVGDRFTLVGVKKW